MACTHPISGLAANPNRYSGGTGATTKEMTVYVFISLHGLLLFFFIFGVLTFSVLRNHRRHFWALPRSNRPKLVSSLDIEDSGLVTPLLLIQFSFSNATFFLKNYYYSCFCCWSKISWLSVSWVFQALKMGRGKRDSAAWIASGVTRVLEKSYYNCCCWWREQSVCM